MQQLQHYTFKWNKWRKKRHRDKKNHNSDSCFHNLSRNRSSILDAIEIIRLLRSVFPTTMSCYVCVDLTQLKATNENVPNVYAIWHNPLKQSPQSFRHSIENRRKWKIVLVIYITRVVRFFLLLLLLLLLCCILSIFWLAFKPFFPIYFIEMF